MVAVSGVTVGGPAALLLLLAAARLGGAQLRQSDLLPEVAGHAGLARLDLQWCGTGSEAQVSRGPLDCGAPVVGDHPWLVALGFTDGEGQVHYGCSGALISDQHVVTSARCAVGSKELTLSTVRAGDYSLATARDCLWYAPDDCLSPPLERPIRDVIVHPSFRPHFNRSGEPSLFDLALVKLSEPLTLEFGRLPVCLPLFSRPPPKKQFAIGYGLAGPPPTLDGAATCCNCTRDRSATSHVMDAEKLVDFNSTFNGSEPCQYRLLGAREGEPDRCVGAGHPCVSDMGAPMVGVSRFGAHFFLLGVASVVPSPSACQSTPGASVVYVPIAPHVKWLLDSIDQLSNPPIDPRNKL